MRLAIVVATEPGIRPLGLRGKFEANMEKIAELGYDGVELFIGDPDQLDVKGVKRLAKKYDLSIPAIGTGLTYTIHGLSFTSPDERVRKRAVERVKEYLKVGKELNSAVIIGSVKGKAKNYQRGLKYLKSCLKACAKFAEESEGCILIEPLNRYESNIINTLEEAIRLVKEIDSDQVRVMADTFHMNIEERSICDSIMRAKAYLAHVHFADSNRQALGQGHLDFKKIIDALKQIDYKNFITAEILPLPNQYDAARLTIEYLKNIIF